MKKLNIASVITAQYKPYSSKIEIKERENTLRRDFTTKTINEKWVGDISLYPYIKRWLVLFSINYGYSFSKAMDTNLIIAALKNAYEIQKPSGSVIFHSDLGTQYTSEAYR